MSLKDWVDDGEKYALVGLSVKTADDFPHGKIAPHLWVLSQSRLEFPEEWTEWLGSIRAEDVADSNLLLLSKQPSQQPDVLDGENKRLQRLVSLFYVGLLLSSTFATSHKPVLLTGARRGDEMGIRQAGDFEAPVPCEFRPYPEISARELEDGARLGLKIQEMEQTRGRWRFFRVLQLYQETRAVPDLLERIHQYARCIDGLILPDPGRTKQQFKSRTELFIGPRHHELMGDIYDVRSAVEHLHVNRYLEEFNREVRLDLLQKEAIAEYMARTSLSRIIDNPALWPCFSNTASLERFWAMSSQERQASWGEPQDINDALEGYEPKYISDAMLGKHEGS
jgi:hypothetical protein